MLKFYSNRQLSSILEIPLSRWKRWSREFLPPDPLGGLQSGFARQFSIRDAFVVYLAGYLVSNLGYTIPEARQILHDLNGWLKKNIIDPCGTAAGVSPETVQQTIRFEMMITPVQRHTQPAFSYRIRNLMDRRLIEGGAIWQERYTEQLIKPGEALLAGSYPACPKWLPLSAVAEQFFNRLS